MRTISRSKKRAACLGLLFGALLCTPSQAQEFFRGKQVTIVVGFTAGGGYDLTARLYARHYGRHIPGNPTVIVSNMPGAGSAVAAASVANTSPQDGTRLGFIAGGAVIDPLLTGKARYDARTFQWIGGRANEPSICGIWHEAGVRTMQDAMTRQAIIGASGPGSRTLYYPKILNELTGTQFKVVTGYPGGNEIAIAMERREVDGWCGISWGSAKTRLASWLSGKKMHILTQFALTRGAELKDVPLAGEFAKNERDRKAIEFLESDAVFAWPMFAPPGTPAERVRELRAAFEGMLKDPQFLADAAKQDMDIDLVPGTELQRLVGELYATPPDVIEIVKKAM
jgi:tripartite-type tricarboxylate transporter receptor subunit TctC